MGDDSFEEEALAAWKDCQLNGTSVAAESLHELFDQARTRAVAVADRRKK